MITRTDVEQYQREGYVVVRTLFRPDEVERYREHFMRLRGQGSYPGDVVGGDSTSDDMDGSPVEIPRGEAGGAGGVWVEQDGSPVIEMSRAHAKQK